MATIGDVLDQCDDFYSEADDTEKLRHMQRAHSRILRAVPLEPTIVTYSSLVADTKEYETGDTYLRVWSVRYVKSATEGDSIMLAQTSVDELDNSGEDWRGMGSSTPSQWYWRAGKIGLHKTPDTSTSGGYPNLSLEVSADQTIDASTTLPGHIRHFEAWVFDTLENVARARRDWDAVADFRAKRIEAMAELVRMHQQRTARYHPRQTMDMGMFNVERI